MKGELIVYSRGWVETEAVKEDETPVGLLHSRVVVEGVEIKSAAGVTVRAQGGDFVEAVIRIHPSSVRFVGLTDEEWARDDLSEFDR
jgi:ribosomal protein L24